MQSSQIQLLFFPDLFDSGAVFYVGLGCHGTITDSFLTVVFSLYFIWVNNTPRAKPSVKKLWARAHTHTHQSEGGKKERKQTLVIHLICETCWLEDRFSDAFIVWIMCQTFPPSWLMSQRPHPSHRGRWEPVLSTLLNGQFCPASVFKGIIFWKQLPAPWNVDDG